MEMCLPECPGLKNPSCANQVLEATGQHKVVKFISEWTVAEISDEEAMQQLFIIKNF